MMDHKMTRSNICIVMSCLEFSIFLFILSCNDDGQKKWLLG